MIRISQLRLRPDHTENDLQRAICRKLGLKPGTEFNWKIVRRSIDARKSKDIRYVYTVEVESLTARLERTVMKHCRGDFAVSLCEPVRYVFPHTSSEITGSISGKIHQPPVIVGAGPAGLFCALMLARSGLKPIVIERGENAEKRAETVRAFWDGGKLDTDSNVSFGEGGAGTFSDGKLNTTIKDPDGLIRFVLETFVSFGADPDILVSARPHAGTDVLTRIVSGMRKEILSLGGNVLFSHRLEAFEPAGAKEPGRYRLHVKDIKSGSTAVICTDALVLAIGHSARDTFRMLQEKGMAMQQKAFAVGVRVQHPQKMIDEAMYGEDCPYELESASYKLTGRSGGRGVYSFCMCPGGYVVNASSEKGMLAVNGMSYHDRASGSANAAIVVTVSPEQYAAGDPDELAGIGFQRMLEKKAYKAGGGDIPVQTFPSFCGRDTVNEISPDNLPAVKGRWRCGDVRSVFPEELAACIEEGILGFDRSIPGFSSDSTLLFGVESRTSSPVRIVRGENHESVSHPGVFPCGEGAGYAGGITSAAADGIRTAAALIPLYLGCRDS